MGVRIERYEEPIKVDGGDVSVDFIGAYTYIGVGANIQFTEKIGRYCSIAKNVTIGEHEHPIEFFTTSPISYTSRLFAGDSEVDEFYKQNSEDIVRNNVKFRANNPRFNKVVVGNDVWIGDGAIIRRGVTIGDGAIVASRSVVNEDVPPYSIYAGVPAKLIKYRFPESIVESLTALKWWDYSLEDLKGVDLCRIEQFIIDLNRLKTLNLIQKIDREITSGL